MEHFLRTVHFREEYIGLSALFDWMPG
jgi:hypothetical protein